MTTRRVDARLIAATTLAAALLGALGLARAAHAGAVTGTVEVSAPPPTPAPRTRGFLDRVDNPYLPVRKPDPMPQLVVVLEGGPGGEPGPAPAVPWSFLGEGFAVPLLPVVAGSEIELKNDGRNTPVLTADGAPDLLPSTPLNPTQITRFKVASPGRTVTIRDTRAPHRIGRILVLPLPYFAVPLGGRFEIANVPPGEYTVKVWYQTGWLAREPVKVTVGPGKSTVNLKLESLAVAPGA